MVLIVGILSLKWFINVLLSVFRKYAVVILMKIINETLFKRNVETSKI